jgi:hypothetical protein
VLFLSFPDVVSQVVLFGYTLTYYQTILDCSEANEGFYVKCGFKRAGLEMAHYYGQSKPKGGQ